jgi:hypothetical protein
LQKSELPHVSQQEKNQGKAGSQKILQDLPQAHPAQRGEGVGQISKPEFQISNQFQMTECQKFWIWDLI